jgi:hypothetical protein
MSFSITDAAEELMEEMAWQKTPEPISAEQYEKMILRGIKRLLIDTGRALEYDSTLVYENEHGKIFDMVFNIDEIAYIMLCAKIGFFHKVQTDVNNIVSYTTDALSVTQADKPYAHLKDTVAGLENDRRILYYKMHRYALGYVIDDSAL